MSGKHCGSGRKEAIMTAEKLAGIILDAMGGKENVLRAENCMTRLRITLKDGSVCDPDHLSGIPEILSVIHEEPDYVQIVLGPQRVQDTADAFRALLPAVQTQSAESSASSKLRILSDIFTPMVPAMIAAGISKGIAGILTLLVTNAVLPDTAAVTMIRQMFQMISDGFMVYFPLYTGFCSAPQFGVAPVLGGMIGGIALSAAALSEHTAVSLLGVVLGVWLYGQLEKRIHRIMPKVLDTTFTALAALMVFVPVYVLGMMPVSAYLSAKIGDFLSVFLFSEHLSVSLAAGFVLAASFLPLVLLGLHRGLIPLYVMQIEQFGGTTLFPVAVMAGAGQVGAAAALYIKAKRSGNTRLCPVIAGALPAGILGIGEPLIYSVTLPLVRPFITACLGAGFGGAWILAHHVMSTSFSPSGILAVTIMVPEHMILFLAGLVISYIMGAVLTWFFVPVPQDK